MFIMYVFENWKVEKYPKKEESGIFVQYPLSNEQQDVKPWGPRYWNTSFATGRASSSVQCTVIYLF